MRNPLRSWTKRAWTPLAGLAISLSYVAALTSAAAEIGSLVTCDPSKVLGYETCQKCHSSEIDVWKKTPHYETYQSLHRKPEAQQIADRMGIRSIKRGELCIECHYTQQQSGSRTKAISGISCESCHGAAQDWLAQHNDYGGPTASKQTESRAHQQQRVAASMRAGMRNPANVYLIASSCFQCHSVPHERLVNVGGHTAGSEGFEFVAWSQGRIRHNFLASNYTTNDVSSPERLRVMYVAGQLAKLEYGLRACAKATAAANYGLANGRRTFEVRKQLAIVQQQVNHPLLIQALDAAYSVKLKSNNTEALELAADQVAAAGYEFAQSVDGGELSAVDAFLPVPSEYK